MTPDGPRIIEVNARVAGGGIGDLFAMSIRGVPAPDRGVGGGRSRSPRPGTRPRSEGVAYQLFVQPPRGARRLVGIEGLGDDRLPFPEWRGCQSTAVSVMTSIGGREARGYLLSVVTARCSRSRSNSATCTRGGPPDPRSDL